MQSATKWDPVARNHQGKKKSCILFQHFLEKCNHPLCFQRAAKWNQNSSEDASAWGLSCRVEMQAAPPSALLLTHGIFSLGNLDKWGEVVQTSRNSNPVCCPFLLCWNQLIFPSVSLPASASMYVPTVCNGREVLDSTTSSLWLWLVVQFLSF